MLSISGTRSTGSEPGDGGWEPPPVLFTALLWTATVPQTPVKYSFDLYRTHKIEKYCNGYLVAEKVHITN